MATTTRKRAPSKQAAVAKVSTPPSAKDTAQPPAIAAATEPPVSSRRPKQKLVRDSFTMPRQDFELISALKQRMIAFKRPARKSELLRAGLHGLMMLPDARLAAALDGLPAVKPGMARKGG